MGYQHEYEKRPCKMCIWSPGIGLPGAWITISVRAIIPDCTFSRSFAAAFSV